MVLIFYCLFTWLLVCHYLWASATDTMLTIVSFLQGAPVGESRGKKNLVLSGWGDESLLSEELINPYYIGSDYLNYSEQTRRNLVCIGHFEKAVFHESLLQLISIVLMQKRLNEDTIDYDLLEDLVCHIDETYSEGAILIFLPVGHYILLQILLCELVTCLSGMFVSSYSLFPYDRELLR